MIEIFLRNSCFLLLGSTMVCYWFGTFVFTFSNVKKIGIIGMFFGNICLLCLILFRWNVNGYYPLSNLYESLIFLGWSITFVDLLLEKVYHMSLPLLGTIISPLAFFIVSFANFSLSQNFQTNTTLVPALKSNWLGMHVTTMILSYTALLIGCLLSINYLITVFIEEAGGVFLLSIVPSEWSKILDNLSYRILGVGFLLLTIGILSGAVWANEAWGSYWSWDPKETWAFITWLIFAMYLHTRILKGWTGKKSAFLASFGFVVVWICYLGVNLFGKGLHSYGWFSIN